MRSRPQPMRHGRSGSISISKQAFLGCWAGFLLLLFPREISQFVETRLLILNADPVFQDRVLSVVDMLDEVESRIVRSLP